MTSAVNVWQNWGRTASCTPADRVAVATPDEVVAVVRDARESGTRVKPLGAGHSFTPIATTDGTHLDLSGLRGVTDHGDGLVTMGAGTHLHELPGLLGPLGLGMENLGDIDRQTIAGALSTGTHGTGLRFGGVATQVRGLTLVDGTGTVHRIGRGPGERSSDVPLEAAAVSLGALGVITDITLQLVPAFVLQAVERRERLGDVLRHWRERHEEADHFEFYVLPGQDPATGVAFTKTNTRLPLGAPLRPLGRLRRLVEDELLGNGAYELLCRAGHARPGLVPGIHALMACTYGSRTFTDISTGVFTTSRRVRFAESEYAVPFEAVPDVVAELQREVARRRLAVSFPVEVRAAAADDVWLSTAYRRRSGYVAVHRYWREDPTEYVQLFEQIVAAHDGRPHWGKMHSLGHERLRELYPRLDDVVALRDRLDPGRVLANDYLTRVLGH